jgi:hypothetical protein
MLFCFLACSLLRSDCGLLREFSFFGGGAFIRVRLFFSGIYLNGFHERFYIFMEWIREDLDLMFWCYYGDRDMVIHHLVMKKS